MGVSALARRYCAFVKSMCAGVRPSSGKFLQRALANRAVHLFKCYASRYVRAKQYSGVDIVTYGVLHEQSKGHDGGDNPANRDPSLSPSDATQPDVS